MDQKHVWGDWLQFTVTSKTVAMSNLDVVHFAHHKHPWEFHFALVGTNNVDERVKSILLRGTHHTGLQGKDQENLTGVLWWRLCALYTTTEFVHVYTRSPIQR